jgi:MerR family transcriptional regulator, thiopeptide resistance regulator
MQTQPAGLRRIKAFATDAGVSVRTLHLYDQLGLLRPAAVSESGYRFYGEAELERLEQILALRFVGFSLQIKELLAESPKPLADALRMQREIIVRQKRRLESALAMIAEAQHALAADESANRWEILRTLMEVFKVRDEWKWAQEYYSERAAQRIEKRRQSISPEFVEQGQCDWMALIAEVEQAVAKRLDPSGTPAQALAQRWRDLVLSFTQGDAEISRGLNRLWSDQTHWPREFQRPWSDAADAFIREALNCRSNGAVDGD